MSNELLPDQLALAVAGAPLSRILSTVLKRISGRNTILDTGGHGVQFRVDLAFSVYDVDVRLDSPWIRFDRFVIDLSFFVRVEINFTELYNSIPGLPLLCITLCIPFTNICYSKCLDLGSANIRLPGIPFSINVAALYKPNFDETADEYDVYPELDSPPLFLIDEGRIIERVCGGMAREFPYPLSTIADDFCGLFAKLFDFLGLLQIVWKLFGGF